MTPALILGFVLLAPPGADTDRFALSLHRSMEIEDLDRELHRLHDTVGLKKSELAATQRLAQRKLASQADLARETADLLHNEAREAETLAYRELKLYERDVLGQAAPPDETKAFALLLDWLKKQEAIAQIDFDYREYTLKQTQSLYQRKAVSRQELDDVGLNYNTAEAAVLLSRSRQAQVAMEIAAKRDDKPFDEAEFNRLRVEFLKVRVHYLEVVAGGARGRLEIAQERSRRGLIPSNEIVIFQKAANDADDNLAADRKKLDEAEAPPSVPAPQPS